MEAKGNMSTTNEILDRHVATFGKQDMAGVLADYAADAVMFTPNGPVRGHGALRKVFERFFTEWSKPGVKFALKQRTVDGNHACIFWDAETAENLYEGAVDAFVICDGKIVAHILSGKITAKAASTA
jgi:ketosteroid isomerase-like protein